MKHHKLPENLKVRDERFKYAIFRVTGKDLDGTPRTLEILDDDDLVEVVKGDEFLVCYLHVHDKG